MELTKQGWRCWSAPNGYHIWAGDTHIADVGDREDSEQSANAHLIVSAVNACIKLNPDNPMAVAEGIPALYEACKELVNEFQPSHKINVREISYSVIEKAIEALAKADMK